MAPQQNSVTYVSGSWVVTGSSTWVGIDGKGKSGTVEQVGTEGNEAWWGMFPSPAVWITSMTVRTGDVMSASVQYYTSGLFAGFFALSITDDSRPNDTYTTLQAPPSVSGVPASGTRPNGSWNTRCPVRSTSRTRPR